MPTFPPADLIKSESEIIEDVDPTTFPLHWTWGGAMDLGIDHFWAYVLMCWDRDQDVIPWSVSCA
jgi:hypothetical protein